MEQNKALITKKVWSLMHAMFLMFKKGISKAKILTDLNTIMKHTGKSLHNLLFHHHHNWSSTTFNRHPQHLPSSTGEYEFSCSDTPPYLLSIFSTHNKKQNNNNNNIYNNVTVMKALEDMLTSATSSPGLVKTPVVKQLRITDSPYPLTNGDDDGMVDEAADKFISRFYNDLRRETK
ncbi:uncharacterized protein LOC143616726 [Bidens hawaiensis]|uniref:uncharacterized protein LOC143616726 n=1 Tax=Bidens hawaiensis TaxID=980011 RepID=UPI00404B8DF7